MRKKKQIRQGDILLCPIEEIPANLKKKDKILAYGEATGHHHRFDKENENVTVLIDKEEVQYVDVGKSSELVHEEHGNIDVPEGKYVLKQQKEHDISTAEDRRVVD